MYCCMSIIVGWKNTFFVKFFCKKTIWRQRRSVCDRQPVFVSIRAPPWCEAYLGTTIQQRGINQNTVENFAKYSDIGILKF